MKAAFAIGGRQISAFRVCGIAGLAVATATVMGLAITTDRSLSVTAIVIASAVATFLVVTMVTKIVHGRERLVFYHDAVAVMAISAAVVAILGRPVLPYLDLVAVGLAAFLAFGRVGCLAVGCCHGRPAGRGVRYNAEHVDAGMSPHFVGPPLVPVQALESAGSAAIAVAGALILAGRPAAGTAFGVAVVTYALLRFGLETLRGDPGRLVLAGLTEAQWTSVVLAAVVPALGVVGALPFTRSAVGAATLVGLLALVQLARARRDAALVYRSDHLRELVAATTLASSFSERGQVKTSPPTIELATTSLGFRVSAGTVTDGSGTVQQYTLSRRPQALSRGAAIRLARLLRALTGHRGRAELLEREDVYHLLLW